MSKLDQLWEKADRLEIKKSWQYQLYITLVLPGILFLLAWLLRSGSTGVMLGRLFHTYSLYVASPLPNLSPFNGTGVLGLGLLAALLVWAVRRRDWPDLLVTAALGGLNLLYFSMEWNYQLLRFLNLTGGVL